MLVFFSSVITFSTYSELDEGGFSQNQRNGYGKAMFPSTKFMKDIQYTGNWEGGIPNGQGELSYSREVKYGRNKIVEKNELRGLFVNGVYQGRTTSPYPDELIWEPFNLNMNHFQKYTIEVMPVKSVYQFYCNLLPKKKTYLRYLSVKKEKTNYKVVTFIMKYFDVSKLQAAEYYDLMVKEDLKLLLKKFGKSDKEIKRMRIR